MITRYPIMPLGQWLRMLKSSRRVAMPALRANWPGISKETEVTMGQLGKRFVVPHMKMGAWPRHTIREAVHAWVEVTLGKRTLKLAYDPTLNLLGCLAAVRQPGDVKRGRPRVRPLKEKVHG